MLRSFFARLIFFSMALSLTTGLSSAFTADNPFSDVSASSPNAQAIRELKVDGVLQGYTDGTFRPAAFINRAELLKIAVESKKILLEPVSEPCFPDLERGAWYLEYVCYAESNGIVSGYPDGLFRPEKPVSFAEAAKIFSLTYKQQIEQNGGEWYTGYIRALESSKAIPTSISGLTANLTRGEMAEMMWRLSKGVTDKPSKGYLNVKYPDVTVNLASDTVQKAQSCNDLSAFAEEARGSTSYGGGIMMDQLRALPTGSIQKGGFALPLTAAPAAQDSAPKETSGNSDYSKTNVQVEGVDEGDVVKTDGTYLYIISGNKVRIVQAVPGSAMKEMSSILDEDSTFSPHDLYIDGNRLIVIGSAWRSGGPIRIMGKTSVAVMPPYWNPSLAQVRIYNVTDRAKPTLERKVSFDGSAVSTRLIGHKLYAVINQPMHWLPQPLTNANETDLMPLFDDSAKGTASMPVARCSDVMILPHVPSPAYLTVGVIDAANPTSDVKRATVLGSAENVYASLQNLYVATTRQMYFWKPMMEGIRAPDDNNTEQTSLYRFAFTADGIALKAQGSVPGRILNQFSMDENGATFRIATTKGQTWDETHKSSNNLFVLNLNLEAMGKIEDIAPGESIYAVRFLGDRAYVVTFKTVDPLFVIDTSDPRNPKILGKLKVPGYSNYLHPYDATHIIGFGKDVDESIDKDKVHNADSVYYTAVQGLKMALFDVADVEHPKELWKEVIGDRGTDSPLLTNHRALLFEKDTGLLAFPITVFQHPASASASEQGQPVFQGAYVYNLSLDKGFQLKGKISHYTDDVYQKAGDWWYDMGKDVQRIVRIAQSLLTVSSGEVRSTSLTTFTKEGSVEFPDAGTSSNPCGRGEPCLME